MVTDSLTFDEMVIITDYFHACTDRDTADLEILDELVRYRCVSDVVQLSPDDEKLHVSPFEFVPAKLMKKVDRIAINQLCASTA